MNDIENEIPQNDNQDDNEESFADLFESYSKGMNEDIRVGERIRGEVISIGADSVYVDTGTKIDGVVEKSELLDKDGQFSVQKGDTLELYVVSMNESEIRLSKALSGSDSHFMLAEAYKDGIPVEGRVSAVCKGGFHVDVMKKRAFCPISQMDLKYVENPEEHVGQTYRFKIKRYEERGRNIVISRRDLMEKELQETRKVFMEQVQAGAVLEGRVTKIMPFGAFVELFPGIEGMVHISELSWSRVDSPEDVVKPGDPITVSVLNITPKGESGQMKISLSLKQATEDPWLSVGTRFQSGQIVQGKVTRCAPFGAFMEIAPGIEGLVHISEMSYTKRVVKAEDIAPPGKVLPVMIKDIDTGKQRISLSIREAEGDPWADVENKYQVGQIVDGTIERKEAFGYFVALEAGITGLMPKSFFSQSADPAAIEKLKTGDAVTVQIAEVRAQERKISLSPGDASESQDWRKYSQDNGGLGTLGHKLQAALKSDKKKE